MSDETANLNPGQLRKIRIIEKTFGPDWRSTYSGMAIDAVYNMAIKDDRKSVFFKTEPHRKEKLAEMLGAYETTIGDFIGMMIDAHYESYLEQRRNILSGIAEDYSGRK